MAILLWVWCICCDLVVLICPWFRSRWRLSTRRNGCSTIHPSLPLPVPTATTNSTLLTSHVFVSFCFISTLYICIILFSRKTGLTTTTMWKLTVRVFVCMWMVVSRSGHIHTHYFLSQPSSIALQPSIFLLLPRPVFHSLYFVYRIWNTIQRLVLGCPWVSIIVFDTG